MKHKNLWKQFSGWMRAFLILALVFLALGLGSLGSVQSTGKSYALTSKKGDSGIEPGIILHIQNPNDGLEESEKRDLYIKEIYVNVGTIYSEIGEGATLKLKYGASASSSFYSSIDVKLVNFYEETEIKDESSETGKTTTINPGYNLFNWVSVKTREEGYDLDIYNYWKIVADGHDILINEIVFVANEQDGSGKPIVLTATVHSNSILPDNLDKASAVVDKPNMPSLAQSSFFRFGQEEAYTLMTISEMRLGTVYSTNSVYNMDSVYNSFGLDIVALGTAIFGISPFGLRVMPFLASFGVLVFGFLFVRRLLHSDKAGFVFAALYALCGLSMSLGHLGTPLMIGLCFFVASLYFCFRFFADGMKRAKLSSTVPLILSGIFAAAAICSNGAFLIPVIGIVALFIAGVVRQKRRDRVELDAAIAEAEKEERNMPASNAEEETPVVSEGKKKVVKVLNENNYKQRASIGVFAAFLVFGALLISILSVLPLFSTFTKVYDNPAEPSRTIFYYMLKAFVGGFVGNNAVYESQSAWSFFYVLFRGTGELYAVTAAGVLVAIAAIVVGIVGAVLALMRLSRKSDDETFNRELTKTLIPVIGFAISLVTAFIAQGALAFIVLACIFLFMLGARIAKDEETSEGVDSAEKSKKGNALFVAALVLVAICFLLFAVFTFSIPLPAAFITSILG